MANGNKWKLRAKISRGARALYITGSPILSARTGESPTFTVTAGGGTPPYTFSKLSGSFATGWSLGASTGIMSGTLTVAASFTSVIRVTDSASPAATADLPEFTTVVASPASAFTVTLTPPGSALTTGTAMQSFGAAAVGTYTAPIVWSIQDTSYYPLPNGIVINSSTGILSGTPTEDGYFSNIVVVGTDNVGAVAYSTPFDIMVHKAGAVVAPNHTDYTEQRTDAFTTTANAVVSLQAQSFKVRNTTNPDPDGSQWYGSTSWPVLTIPPDAAPVAIGSKTAYRTGSTVNQTIRGGLFQGEVSITTDRHILDLSYPGRVPPEAHVYINSRSILVDGSTSNKFTVYRARIDRSWDGIQGVNGGTPYQTSLITECWITNIRDDAIEHDLNVTNELQSPMTISDCLVDGCQAFLSLDSGSGSHPDNTGTLVSVDSCVIRCSTYPQSSGSTSPFIAGDPLHNKALAPFKVTSKSCNLACTNNIIAVEFDLATVTASDKAAMHSYYTTWITKMTTGIGVSTNNKFCWTSDDALPGTGWFGDLGTGGAGVSGWTVYTGATARDILGAAREAWIIAHPWVRKRTAYTPGSVST